MSTSGQPRDVDPQLAVADPDLGPGPWVYERKLDGIRLLVHVSGDEVRLQSRNHKPYAPRLPELVEAVREAAAGDLVADGELVALDGEVTSFGLLQTRLGAASRTRAGSARVDVKLYLFDLLFLNGRDLRDVPLLERKDALKQAFVFRDPVRFTEHRSGDPAELLDGACDHGWEGLIAKHTGAGYRSGRSSAWRKLPCLRSGPFVVGGATRGRGSRSGFGALLLGWHDASGGLRYVGKVGTGFSAAQLTVISSFLDRLEVQDSPFVDAPSDRSTQWVEPVVVLEVAYLEVTSGGMLRQPRFLRVLPGHDPHDVLRDPRGE